jgi:predicted nucleic acid-binding protein
MLGLLGKEQAHVMLRQSVRYCIQQERPSRWIRFGDCRVVLPKMLDKHGLMDKTRGNKKLDDEALERLSRDIYAATPEQAAGLAAEALADGISPDTLGEAISLAACELVLRDPGRPKGQTGPGKPEGSIHGDSIGVHACDSVNAWRNLSKAANARNSAACLILAAFHVAQDRSARGEEMLRRDAYPLAAHREKVKGRDAADLLREAEAGIKSKDQTVAAAAIARYLELKHADKDAFGLMLRYAVSEDGALHAEKFYRTTREEYGRTRPAFRGRYLVALARVTASACGQPAPGHAEACKLLGV